MNNYDRGYPPLDPMPATNTSHRSKSPFASKNLDEFSRFRNQQMVSGSLPSINDLLSGVHIGGNGGYQEHNEVERLRKELYSKDETINRLRMEVENLRTSGGSREKLSSHVQSSGQGPYSRFVEECDNKMGLLFQDVRTLDHRLEEASGIYATIAKENEILRVGLRSFEQGMQKMLAELRAHYDTQGREYERQISSLNEEVTTLKGKVTDLTSQNERIPQLQQENRQAQDELAKARHELDSLRSKIGDYERRHMQMATDMERLSKLLGDKTNECEDLKRRYMEGLSQLEMFKRSTETQAKDIERIKNMYDQQVREMKDKLAALEKTNANLEIENKKIPGMQEEIRDKEHHISRISRAYEELERQNMMQVSELAEELDRLKKALIASEAMKTKLDAERSSLEAQIIQLNQRMKEMDGKLRLAFEDKERHQQAAATKQKEIETLQGRISELERGSFQELENLRMQLDAYKRANLNAREMSLKFGVEKANYEREIDQFRHMMSNTANERSKMGELFETFKKDNESLKEQIEQLRQQNYTLSNTNSNLENERNKLNEQLQSQKQEINSLSKSRDSYKMELEQNGVDLARKNQELQRKLSDLEGLHSRGFDPTSLLSKGFPTESSPYSVNKWSHNAISTTRKTTPPLNVASFDKY